MLKRSTRVALGGMVAALCIVLMLLTGVLPFLTYAVPAMAGLMMIVVVVECGTKWAMMVYLAVSLLSLLVAPDKVAAFVFVFFLGYYPILKSKLEHIRPRVLEWFFKLLLFNVAVVTAFLVMIYGLQMPNVMTEMGGLGRYTGVTTLALANVGFIVFDRAVTRVTSTYIHWFRPKFLRRFG